MKRGDWVLTASDINKMYADRVGRIMEVNTERFLTRTHTELLVKFAGGYDKTEGKEAWFLPPELTLSDRPRGARGAVRLTSKSRCAAPLVDEAD